MTWMYQGNPIDQLPEDCAGFVYIIVNLQTNRKYIGKKLAKFSKIKRRTVKFKNGNKRKRKIRTKIESDWKTYWSSSTELLADIAKTGKENFSREILRLCKSKAECSYFEAKYQFDNQVLESNDYYNGHIQIRVHKSHINGKISNN